MGTAKLFQNGHSQAVRLPKEFHLPGKEVTIHKLGSAVILMPVQKAWDNVRLALDGFSKDFMKKRNQPETQKREKLF